MTTSTQVVGQLRLLERDRRPARVARPLDEGHAPLVAPDDGRTEHVVAEGVVEVPVRVHDDRDRRVGQVADVGQDLARLYVRGPRVDDEGLAVAEDQPDVLVVEGVAAHEEPIADLDPAVFDTHRRMVSTASDDGPKGRVRCAHAIDRQPRHRGGRHGPARPALAARRGRGRRGMGRQAVGLDPAGPRSGRAVRSLRACRRPVRERRARCVGVRPARQRRLGRAARRHRTLVAVPRRPRRTTRGGPGWRRWPTGRGLRPLDGWARRRRLPPERPAQAGSRGARVARPRFRRCPGGRSRSRAFSRGSRRRSRSRTASMVRRCHATRRSARRPAPTPGTPRPARPGSVPRDSPSRLAFELEPQLVSASRRWSCTASTTAWSHRRRPRSSKAPQASSGARFRASATSSTTNPRAPRSSKT